ncbi:MAG: homoserine dehydrogenase [Candidatus Jordarchaeales archaeon]
MRKTYSSLGAESLNLILIGFGNVGRALARILWEKIDRLRGLGLSINVTGIFKSNGGFVDSNGLMLGEILEKSEQHKSWVPGASPLSHIEELPCDVVVEMTPTNVRNGEPGVSFIRKALEEGKDVVTSNKGPLVVSMKSLLSLAERKGCFLLYEATVGAAIPIFTVAREFLRHDRIICVEGILNGTTNYILSRMSEDKVSFDDALREAQEMGYAEADPTYDVEGIDAACKLVILANGLMNMDKHLSDVEIEGISRVTPEMIELAEEDGYLVKHVAYLDGEKMEVAPRLVPKNSPLAVGGTFNVITLNTELSGPLTFIGKGAGPRETASAILADIITIAKKRGGIKSGEHVA